MVGGPHLTFAVKSVDTLQAQAVFPEMLRRIIVVNPPMIFSAVFALTKPFLNQRVLDKIVVISKSDNLHDRMEEFIADEFLPTRHGARFQTGLCSSLCLSANEDCVAPCT
jgi:hypothetical protein